MKHGTLFQVISCEDENPKESGEYKTDLDVDVFYSDETGWDYVTDGASRHKPKFWLKPLSKSVEEIQEEAFEAARQTVITEFSDKGALVNRRYNTFQEWKSKQQDK